MRTILLIAFLFTTPAQAQCFEPESLHKILIDSGYTLFIYGDTIEGYLIEIYTSDELYVIVLEDKEQACIAGMGKSLYESRRLDI